MPEFSRQEASRLPVSQTLDPSGGASSAPSGSSRAFLLHFPERERSAVANLFLLQVRRGASDPAEVVARATTEARGRLQRAVQYNDALWYAKVQEILDALQDYPEEAADLARWAIEWESLPHDERERRKAERGQQYKRQWMAHQPATEKQMAYLHRLGYRGPVASRQQASELIDRLSGRSAS